MAPGCIGARGESAAAREMRRGRMDVARVSRRSPRDGSRQTAVARFTSVCCLVLAGLRRKSRWREGSRGSTRQHARAASLAAGCSGCATPWVELVPMVLGTPCTWPRTTCAVRVRQLRRGPAPRDAGALASTLEHAKPSSSQLGCLPVTRPPDMRVSADVPDAHPGEAGQRARITHARPAAQTVVAWIDPVGDAPTLKSREHLRVGLRAELARSLLLRSPDR